MYLTGDGSLLPAWENQKWNSYHQALLQAFLCSKLSHQPRGEFLFRHLLGG